MVQTVSVVRSAVEAHRYRRGPVLPWMDDVTEKTHASFDQKGHFPVSI